MAIKPIETYYKGYRFRSRLEARWAVFFEVAGIEYHYEPEGLAAGGIGYLPDFFLPKVGAWVEVKGSQDAMRFDAKKIVAMAREEDAFRLLVLGDVPLVERGLVLHPLVRQSGLFYAYFSGARMLDLVDWNNVELAEWMTGRRLAVGSPASDLAAFPIDAVYAPTQAAPDGIADAYRAARAARFEFGEAA